jgi:Rrf2 family protein
VSQNGPKGGYVLAKSPDSISVLSIIQAIEGHLGITECYHNEDSQCMQMARCNIRTPLRNIQNSIYGLLDSMSIEDMSTFSTATIAPPARLFSTGLNSPGRLREGATR